MLFSLVMRRFTSVIVMVCAGLVGSCINQPKSVPQNPAVKAHRAPSKSFSDTIDDYRSKLFKEGRKVFRHDTFGSEAFFGGTLQLHKAILGEGNGGIGPGVSPLKALEL